MITELKTEDELGAMAYPKMPVEQKNMTLRNLLVIPILIGILILVAALGVLVDWQSRHPAVPFPTTYQAVLLSNGAVYYGELQGYGTSNPILTHVFYIVSHADPNSKAVSNILVKRGKELHAPDRMYLNPASIVFVETVGKNSKVAQLIAEGGN